MTVFTNNDVHRPLQIAFHNFCSKGWFAGCNYLKNLFVAIKTLEYPPKIVLYGSKSDQSYQVLIPYTDKLLFPPPLVWKARRALYFAQRKARLPIGVDMIEAFFLRKQKVNAVFAMGNRNYGQHFGLPLLGWLPDFQHRHLPEMFSTSAIQDREEAFLRTAKYANRIILSSHTAEGDFQEFHPNYAHKVRVLRFVAQVPSSTFTSDLDKIRRQYDLPERYFFLPNQFWKHKNHEVVIKALSIAKQQNSKIVVVCTGNTSDPRNILHFSQLKQLISDLAISHNIVILGMISQEHILPLMRQSLAVLQPSLFEGWSTTVEEAKSVGKHIILSDIPVHKEQAPPQAIFFDPHDPQALADHLVRTFKEANPGPDRALEAQAREQLLMRTKEFGQGFIKIVLEIVP